MKPDLSDAAVKLHGAVVEAVSDNQTGCTVAEVVHILSAIASCIVVEYAGAGGVPGLERIFSRYVEAARRETEEQLS